MPERVLITGAGGFMGRHLARELPGAVGLGRGERPEGWAGEWLQVDVRDSAAVAQALQEARPRAVFHLAALLRGEPGELEEVNVAGTAAVLDAAAEAGAEVVLVGGSSAEYGAVPEERLPIGEDEPVRPVSPYGESKAAQTRVALERGRDLGLRVHVARAFNVLGPDLGDGLAAGAFARQVAAAEAGKQEPVIRTGYLGTTRDYVDVRDLVRAYVLLAERGEENGPLNVCSGVGTSTRVLLELLMAKADVSLEVREEGGPSPADVPVQIGDPTRIRAATGWQPEIPLERTLGDLLDHWRNSKDAI